MATCEIVNASKDEFGAGNYNLNADNEYPSHDNRVATQHEALHLTPDRLSEDQQYVDQDDQDDVISVARYINLGLNLWNYSNATIFRNSSTISEVELVVELDQLDETFSETNPKKKFKHSGDVSVTMSDDTACQNRSVCQQKIKAQAEEIARLKQLIERQNSKIKSLEP